ncbi:sulfatase [Gimesia aquarii]|uniref:sulfatase n=1 Tax=Gimesia aquarii TaxID=2527964 RepID=UPI0011A11BBF|nr:sulfatase [Gimesia aquarii]
MEKRSEIKNYTFATVEIVSWLFPNTVLTGLVFLLFLIEQILHFINHTSIWINGGLTVGAQLGLVGISFLAWTLIIWIGYSYFKLVIRVINRVSLNAYERIIFIVSLIPLVIFVNLYIWSWVFFARLGIFPDLDAIYFAALNVNMLSKYFWQAERSIWVMTLIGILLISFVCSLVFSWCLRQPRLLRRCGKDLFIPQIIIFLVCINTVFFLSDFLSSKHYQLLEPQDRIEALKNPWASSTFELRYHTNPTVTLACSVFNGTANVLTDEIPLKYMSPLGSIKPGFFPAISPDKKKNIILITIESLRSDTILMEHQGKLVMPHVEKLARNGHFFPNCYASSTHSDYSDPAILSSLYPLRSTRTHFYGKEDPWPKVMIYDLLKEYDYATAMFSSQNEAWSNMHLFYESPCLDIFFDSRTYKGQTISEKGYFSHWQSETGMIAGKLDDAITIDHAIDWMERQHQQQIPFFMSLNLQTSHFPYERPDDQAGPFHPCKLDSKTTLYDYSLEERPVVKNAYFNALNYVDLQIGRLLDSLQKNEISDETIIVITGDHGEAFYENGFAGHATFPFETVLKVGLVINSPTINAPKIDKYLVHAVDIVPTITAFLGIPTHPAFQGIDIFSKERPANDERVIFVHACNPIVNTDAIVTGIGWKYVINHRTEKHKIFLLPTDLEPHSNLIEEENQVAEILHRLCSEWRKNQLTYYNSTRYYNWFYAPKPPRIRKEDLAVLRKRASEL